jgi:UDP-N-acetyl-D-galactosamine dehydrogenase
MAQNEQPVRGGRVLILGLTFKENCPDIRNSKVVDVIRELKSYGAEVDVYDPHANADEVLHEYGFGLTLSLEKKYNAIVLAVCHDEFKNLPWEKIRIENAVVFDVKGFLDKSIITARL